MKSGYKIIAIAIGFGLFFWVIDAFLDFLLFCKGTFLELFLTEIPSHEIYMRLFVLALFVGFGMILSIILHKRKQTEDKFRIMDFAFKSSSSADSMGNNEGFLTHVNPAFARIWGYDNVDEVIGKPILDFLANKDEALEIIESLHNTGKWEGEYTALRKDGSTFIALSSANAVYDDEGNQTALYSSVVDLTERLQAEEKLRESEKQFSLLLEQVPNIAIQGYYDDGIVFYWNTANEAIYGYTSEEAIGKNLVDLIIPPEMQDFVREAIKIGGQTGEMPPAMELKLMRKDRSLVDVFSSHAVIIRPNNKSVMFCFDIDITERIQAEKQIKELEEQFRQAQKMEAIGVLAGGVAHDFNNILNVILGYSELVIDKLHEDDPMLHKIDNIRKSAESATSLTRQLLAFSRKQILQPTVLNLNNIVKDMENMLLRLIGENIDLESVLEEDLYSFNADYSQIEQIIMNIVVNARDAMPEGGKLLIETQNVEFDEEYVKNYKDATIGHHVMLAISDTGIGMTKDIQERIFEPFFTTKKLGKGTGLGISTVYGIVKQSGGSIRVYSEVGKGTTFKIYFPAEMSETRRKQVTITEPIIRKKTVTILVVEDNQSMCEMIGEILNIEGFRTFLASNPIDAISIYEEHEQEIDIILTDVIMPEMSGKILVKNLQNINPHLKVLFMSGYTDNAIAHHGVLDPGISFIQKPFMVKELIKKIFTTLDEPDVEIIQK